MGSDAAEFVDKVKDQVRNRQERMSNVAESGEEHSNNMGNVHGCDVLMWRHSWERISQQFKVSSRIMKISR